MARVTSAAPRDATSALKTSGFQGVQIVPFAAPLQIHVLRNFQLRGYLKALVVSDIKGNGEPIGLGDAGHYWLRPFGQGNAQSGLAAACPGAPR